MTTIVYTPGPRSPAPEKRFQNKVGQVPLVFLHFHQRQQIRLEVTPELINALRKALTGVQVIEEAPETPQIAAPKEETRTFESMLQELDRLLPDVFPDEITAAVTANRDNIPRREMCSYLNWGGSKYSSIVKPVLDAYEQL